MLTPEQLVGQVPGMTLAQARRIEASMSMQETPNAKRALRLFTIPAPYMGLWWCGETRPGVVKLEIYAEYCEQVQQVLTDNGLDFTVGSRYIDKRLHATMQSIEIRMEAE